MLLKAKHAAPIVQFQDEHAQWFHNAFHDASKTPIGDEAVSYYSWQSTCGMRRYTCLALRFN
tara:strand:+ start:1820 stop:2005 length:186 start_codon:yes stop_codon:yes gene_type:complete